MHRPVSRCYFEILAEWSDDDRAALAAKIQARSRLEVEPNPLVGTPCRLWLGELASNEYGLVRMAGREAWPAHRVALALSGQYDASDRVVDHLCRTRRCVRVDHLELVTSAVNVLRGDGPSAVNARKIDCSRGHLLAGENVYFDTRGNRRCRLCHGFLNRRLRARARAAA